MSSWCVCTDAWVCNYCRRDTQDTIKKLGEQFKCLIVQNAELK